jgi:hypothetical protein
MSKFSNVYKVSNAIRVACALAATVVVLSLFILLSSGNFMLAVFPTISGIFALSISVFGRDANR